MQHRKKKSFLVCFTVSIRQWPGTHTCTVWINSFDLAFAWLWPVWITFHVTPLLYQENFAQDLHTCSSTLYSYVPVCHYGLFVFLWCIVNESHCINVMNEGYIVTVCGICASIWLQSIMLPGWVILKVCYSCTLCMYSTHTTVERYIDRKSF